MRQGVKNFKFNSKIALALVCIFIATLLSFGGVFAKYINERGNDINVSSPQFYFSSDLLTENGAEYILNPGTDKIQIILKNYGDQLRFSPRDISYTLTTSDGFLSINNGSLSGGTCKDVIIELSGLTDGGTYTVTAVGNMQKGEAQGFKQTLSATFTVKQSEPKIYYYNDASDDYLIYLSIWTDTLEGDVTVTIPTGLLPDNTCQGLENLEGTDTSFVITDFGSFDSHMFRFFKTSSYTGSDFTIILEDSNGVTYTAISKKPV